MRRVNRVVRDGDVWSVFKVDLVFHLVLFIRSFDCSQFAVERCEQHRHHRQRGERLRIIRLEELHVRRLGTVRRLLRVHFIVGGMFNLITELVGGVRVTVLEEEVMLFPSRDWPLRMMLAVRSRSAVG